MVFLESQHDFFFLPYGFEGFSALPLLAGFLAAFLSGVLACKWMIAIVTRGKLIHFAIYCFIAAIAAIIAHYAAS